MKLRDNAGLRLDLETIAQDELGHRMGATMVYRILDAVDRVLAAPSPETGAPTPTEQLYPCARCGVSRTRAEGGRIFTVCDTCWNKGADPAAEPGKPATCPTCKGSGEVLFLYQRGPGDPPGNQMIQCPMCRPEARP